MAFMSRETSNMSIFSNPLASSFNAMTKPPIPPPMMPIENWKFYEWHPPHWIIDNGRDQDKEIRNFRGVFGHCGVDYCIICGLQYVQGFDPSPA
jgi:hypothetical protein